MIFSTGDLESVPILLTMALAADDEDWTVEITTVNGETHLGVVSACGWQVVTLHNEDTNVATTVAWDDVEEVLVP